MVDDAQEACTFSLAAVLDRNPVASDREWVNPRLRGALIVGGPPKITPVSEQGSIPGH